MEVKVRDKGKGAFVENAGWTLRVRIGVLLDV